VAKFDSVGEEKGLGFAVYNMKAPIVLESDSNVEAIASAEVPRLARARLVVDEDLASGWTDGSGVIIEGAIEISPCGLGGVESGLAKKV
jgi:hypothetical protein